MLMGHRIFSTVILCFFLSASGNLSSKSSLATIAPTLNFQPSIAITYISGNANIHQK